MFLRARLLILGAIGITGCTTAHDVAVTSFRVLDTPARFVRDRIDPPQTTTTTTTTQTYGTSDVANPGQPVPPPQERPSPQRSVETQTRERSRTVSSGASAARPTATPKRKSSPAATPRAATQTVQFPTAKPVPGRPGYVYSVDPKGGIVDVTGYKTGDRAKDPYTQQIFIVP